jgi:ribose transport system permease protein
MIISMKDLDLSTGRFVTFAVCVTATFLRAAPLLAIFSDGAALNMGCEYRLTSIAVVVIGGTAVSAAFRVPL